MAFRDGPFEKLKVPVAWTAAVAVVIALIAAVMMLLGDRREAMTPESYGATRAGFDTAAAPVGGVLSAPGRWVRGAGDYVGGYFNAVSENRRLKAEIVELEAWRDQARALANLNARYEALLGVQPEPPVPTVGARVVTDARGPFARARLINAGSSKAVRVGNPVVSQHGLVGRVVGVAPIASRVLLVTDVASRTPVMIERTNARALLAGDASANPRLDFVRGEDVIQEGDRIVTSGDGGGIPRGIPVGVAARGLDGAWRVKLFSDRDPVDVVKVLLFQDFAQLVNQNQLNAPPLAGLNTAPSPSPELAAAVTDAANRRLAQEQAAARQREEAILRARIQDEARREAAAQQQAQAQEEARQRAAAAAVQPPVAQPAPAAAPPGGEP